MPEYPSISAPDRGGARTLVRARGLQKRFGATMALNSVDFDVRPGEIVALLGQNGAGKSTLIKILAGVYRADAGEVSVAGHVLGSAEARRAMSFIHQDLGLVEWMTVAENIALGTGYPRAAGLISWRRARDRCVDALAAVGRALDPDTRVADLTRADRSLVAIARALSMESPVIVLDEPTASLPATDCARLFEVLRVLRERGHGIIYVSHRLDEVFEIADSVAVLRDGGLVSRGELGTYTPQRLVAEIVGHGSQHIAASTPAVSGEAPVVLRLQSMRTRTAGPVDLDLRAGEVVGMVGLTNAGQLEVGRALSGAQPITAGQVTLDIRPYRPRTVANAVDAGVGFVTSNRHEEGCLLGLTVRENFLANPRARGAGPARWINPRSERVESQALVRRFGVRPRNTEAPIATLSGGNQQKVMIGRWLGVSRRLVILEEPTAGVDVGAKAEIYQLLDEALRAGVAVLLISTDFEEVVNVCRRALVFVRGAVTTELTGDSLTVSGLTQAASAAAISGAEAIRR